MASTETSVVATPTSTVGASEYRVNILCASGGVVTMKSEDTVTDPPTSGEMVTAFGTAASVGDGYMGLIDSGGAGTSLYLCVCDGTNWHATKLGVVAAKWTKVLYVPSPLNSDAFPVMYFPAAATITRVHGERAGGTSVTFNLEERAEGSFFASGTDVFAADEVLTANETWSSGFENAGMAANSVLYYDASAVSGGVTDMILTVEGTWD